MKRNESDPHLRPAMRTVSFTVLLINNWRGWWVVAMLAWLTACTDRTASTDDPIAIEAMQQEPDKPATLPQAFSAYQERLDRSKLNYIKITPVIDPSLDWLGSRFRGVPFLPKGQTHPVNKDGARLVLLVQINFADTPRLDGFPEQGLLQIYIDPGMNQAHVWGMNSYRGQPFDQFEYFQSLQQQDYFKVLYFPPELLDKPASVPMPTPENEFGMPISGPMKLQFEMASEWVNSEDYRFEQHLGLSDDEFYDRHEHLGWDAMDAFYTYLQPDAVAKMGGYGRFVQEDPRTMAMLEEDWLVLLNIESAVIGDEDIMWGDGGVATFFIRKKDLQRLDFSQVAYYWDNH